MKRTSFRTRDGNALTQWENRPVAGAICLAVVLLLLGLPVMPARGQGEAEPAPMVQPGEDLPWRRSRDRAAQAAKRISPAERLEIAGIDDSHLRLLVSGRPLVEDEDGTLIKLMYRVPEFDVRLWEQWASDKVDWEALAERPEEYRTTVYRIRGRAKSIQTVSLLREVAERFEFKHYYRVTMEVPGVRHPVVINTRTIPSFWQGRETLDELVGVYGLFLKGGEEREEGTTLYFAVPRIAWYPDKVNDELHVTEDLVWLASQGMDIALFDDVRDRNGAAISAAEGECFYQLLNTLRRAPASGTPPVKPRTLDLATLLNEPETVHGEVFACRGAARRVQKVTVPEVFRERLGLDHYYEIDFLLPLDRQAIRLTSRKGEEDAPTFVNGFPATFCVVELPEGLKEGDVREDVYLAGVFFKQWVYRSEFVEGFDKRLKQPSPLFMGRMPSVVVAEDVVDWSSWSTTILILLMAGVALLWWSAWRFARSDRNFERKVLRKYMRGDDEPPSKFQMPRRD